MFAFNIYQAEIDENIPLGNEGPHRVCIKVKWDPDLEPIKFNHDAVIAELKAEAAATQEPIIDYLHQKQDAQILNTFWLANLILVEADVSTIRELATFIGVSKIIDDFEVTTLVVEGEAPKDFTVADGSTSWNIDKVRAPDVWDILGITGEGVRFATSDTGLHLEHPDLVGTLYSDDYSDPTYPGGWIEFDGDGNIVPGSVPHDTDGHGTATFGLIVGDAAGPYGAIGMAPGAAGLGMHALNLPGGGGTFPQVVAGLQWIIDPVDQYGNPAGAPAQVSSHSWGATGYFNEMIEPIENMYNSGHFVVAAMGNEGEGSTRSPGNVYYTFGAGATDANDYVPAWSSGAVENWPESWPDPYITPDASAPGDFPIIPRPPDQWVNNWYGTSFSSPHIAGAAVLMLSGNPSLTPDDIEEALEGTAVWYDYYYPEPPDTRYGWGRIDAFEAVMMVALPQGVKGTVTDAVTGDPLSQVEVYAYEADRSVFTDESGYYDLRLMPGTYTLTFSRFGYYEETVAGVVVEADVFTWHDVDLTPIPPGYVEGHVYFLPTMIGIPGATVEVLDVPVTIQAETDADGAYHLTIPPGMYDLETSAFQFSSDLEEDVTVSEGLTTTLDFYLEQPGKIAVIDYYGYADPMIDFLTDEGYTVEVHSNIPAILPYVTEYGLIIANNLGYTYYDDLMDFIDLTDANGIGVLWLDSWSSYCGAYWLNRHLDWPPRRYTSYSTSIEHLYYRVLQTDDDIIPGSAVGDKIIHDDASYFKDHAYYRDVTDGYEPGIGTVKVLTNVGKRWYGYDSDYYDSQGLIKVTRDTDSKWVVMSMHANTYYTDTDNWHDDSKEVFLNAINWATKPHVGIPKFVAFHLDVEPEVTLWKYPVTISVGMKNVGWIAGTDTVEMYINSVFEASEDVTLSPGEYAYLSWPDIYRFNVGTYHVSVKHLTTSFRVRPPEISLKAYEFNKNKPLVAADIYGFYREYAGPGWYEQWSQTWGGYGHSQHAQPVGDIDEDGVNEIILGGYEAPPDWGRARIFSYDSGAGTYIQEHEWYVPGGSYHSPSGSTVVDLDEDGDLEFVVSWTYSGADGIYAYDWDGSTLYELDEYLVGFVFDVYSCDYDDDGDVEVLIANAPWGGTPYHVMAFGWEAGAFVVEATWLLPGYSYMENPMIWSGDTDNDGKTEVIASMSDSSSSTAGTWALNWNSGLGEWEEELVYDDLISGGTHYGVAVGDVDGDGTPEIGIGNNVEGYIGAGAVLMEWDGTTYVKLWEGSWPTEESVIEAISIGDADNDGNSEFVVGGGNVHVVGWTGTNYAEEATITETSGLLSGAIVGDMDSDGLNEIKACAIITGPGSEWIFKYTTAPIPLPKWYFEYFGTTDNQGELVFDSPASVVDMFLFVYKGDKTPQGWQYLLTQFNHWNNDGTITYEPTSATEAVIISRPNARALEMYQHLGVTWLLYDYIPVIWPFTSVKTDPAEIVVSPQLYYFNHWLNIIDPYGAWWYFFEAFDRMTILTGGQTYEYSFGGPVQAHVEHTKVDEHVTIDWNAWDNYDHQITGISFEEVSWLSSGTTAYTPAPIQPSMQEDVEALVGETINVYPLITLYRRKQEIIASGYVQWYEKPAYTMVSGSVEYVALSFIAGPFGNPNARMYVYLAKEP